MVLQYGVTTLFKVKDIEAIHNVYYRQIISLYRFLLYVKLCPSSHLFILEAVLYRLFLLYLENIRIVWMKRRLNENLSY